MAKVEIISLKDIIGRIISGLIVAIIMMLIKFIIPTANIAFLCIGVTIIIIGLVYLAWIFIHNFVVKYMQQPLLDEIQSVRDEMQSVRDEIQSLQKSLIVENELQNAQIASVNHKLITGEYITEKKLQDYLVKQVAWRLNIPLEEAIKRIEPYLQKISD
jgi:archaellum component FlaF (FlaF/FlaG flagellin family)